QLGMIETSAEARGTGSATMAMNYLTAYADSLGKDIELFVAPRDRTTSEERLIDFYHKFGFRQKYGGIEQEMIRNPRKEASARFSVAASFNPNTSTVDEFKDLIQNGTWGMMTAENPDANKYDEAANRRANQRAT